MTIPYFHVDAFADQPFAGNRAAVCLPGTALPAELMQRIADETGLVETSFLWRQDDGFRLQWFTPKVELTLCGHGTLASAHILWERGWLSPGEEAVFYTLGGRLTVRRLPGGWMELDFPAFAGSPAPLPPELAGLFPHSPAVYWFHDRYLIELEDEEMIRGFVPDFEKLRQHRVIITSRAKPGSSFDFVSRFFAGPVGVPEDPVTGSAHCALGPYWSEKLGKKEFLAWQCSARGGVLGVNLRDGRVHIAGKAVTVIGGDLYL